jgi:hypothetical protein
VVGLDGHRNGVVKDTRYRSWKVEILRLVYGSSQGYESTPEDVFAEGGGGLRWGGRKLPAEEWWGSRMGVGVVGLGEFGVLQSLLFLPIPSIDCGSESMDRMNCGPYR